VKLDHYLEGRLYEWSVTISMILLSVESFFWPQTLQFSAFSGLMQVMTGPFVTAFMAGVGIIRAAALLLNGHAIKGKKVGPLLRSVMAVVCATMWVQFSFALFELSINQGRPSPGLPFWTVFVFSELYVAYRAVRKND
jgi:hypothetical protein